MKEAIIWLGVILVVVLTAPLWISAYAVLGAVDCFYCAKRLWCNWRKKAV